jgi:1-acyl-sn-glycerol-3-phosphate acyltransferase
MFIAVKGLIWNENCKISTLKIKLFKIMNKVINGVGFFVIGLFINENKTIDNEVYSKYFGPGVYEDFDRDYSVIISNHISWVEILYFLKKFSAGFISKASVKDFFMIGLIAKKIDCLFLDRTNKEERDNIVRINIISFFIRFIIFKNKNFHFD